MGGCFSGEAPRAGSWDTDPSSMAKDVDAAKKSAAQELQSLSSDGVSTPFCVSSNDGPPRAPQKPDQLEITTGCEEEEDEEEEDEEGGAGSMARNLRRSMTMPDAAFKPEGSPTATSTSTAVAVAAAAVAANVSTPGRTHSQTSRFSPKPGSAGMVMCNPLKPDLLQVVLKINSSRQSPISPRASRGNCTESQVGHVSRASSLSAGTSNTQLATLLSSPNVSNLLPANPHSAMALAAMASISQSARAKGAPQLLRTLSLAASGGSGGGGGSNPTSPKGAPGGTWSAAQPSARSPSQGQALPTPFAAATAASREGASQFGRPTTTPVGCSSPRSLGRPDVPPALATRVSSNMRPKDLQPHPVSASTLGSHASMRISK
uniref:Uncharacterized protein n=1 Tax=Chlamydomonas leiostraca TaxID=1034604 RepID=A0A7S0RMK5_9CHLO|mmetsp:Transcript_26525/g.67474  ORF Transcript_26525/g.67474 Transcript_26525/m.67474 type:complete len:376 (+) Transcript_26525:128-1255(+)